VAVDVARALPLAHRQFKRLAGLAVVHGNGHVPVGRVPEQTNVNAVAGAAVELAGSRRGRRLKLSVEEVRVGRAVILDVWIDHARAPLSIA
jgi:hypothetical protein